MILKKLDDLCSRITRLEEKMDNHLNARMSRQKSNREIVLIIIAIVSTGTAIYQIFV